MVFHKQKLSSRSNSESSSDSRFSDGWEYFEDVKQTVKLTEFEKNAKKLFSFDKHPKYREYNDLRVYQTQNSYRFSKLLEVLKAPFIPLYNSVICVFNPRDYGFRPEKYLQRRLCSQACNWDPTKCFLEDSHGGNLSDIMKKSFHDQFNPAFERSFVEEKYQLRLKEDEDHHPRIYELIKDLGEFKFTYKIQYT